MSDKPKFPRAAAIEVARALCTALSPACARLIVAGSLRRGKQLVSDVELLFIPKQVQTRDGLFDVKQESAVDVLLEDLIRRGALARRQNVRGAEMWGAKNKLGRHVASGIPVDLFTATDLNWWNYLVCRTGSAESNVRIAAAAQAHNWKWNPYGPGFSRGGPLEGAIEERLMQSEREVFEFVGLPYLEPHQR